MNKFLSALGICMLIISPAFAHEPRPGPNGGLMVDAGNYHTELILEGSENVTLLLFDANDQPVESAGFKANAILIINGKAVRFSLQPADGQTMLGKAPSAVEPGVKGAIQITLPDGSAVQAKY